MITGTTTTFKKETDRETGIMTFTVQVPMQNILDTKWKVGELTRLNNFINAKETTPGQKILAVGKMVCKMEEK